MAFSPTTSHPKPSNYLPILLVSTKPSSNHQHNNLLLHQSTTLLALILCCTTLMASDTRSSSDQKLAMAKRCSHEGVVAGAKAAVLATVASAIPTVAIVRMLPWARANLNPTGQALIVSTVAGLTYFIVADKTVLASARKNSFGPSAK